MFAYTLILALSFFFSTYLPLITISRSEAREKMIKKDIKLKLQRLMSTPFSLFHPFCLKTFLSYNLNILNVQNLSYGLFIGTTNQTSYILGK